MGLEWCLSLSLSPLDTNPPLLLLWARLEWCLTISLGRNTNPYEWFSKYGLTSTISFVFPIIVYWVAHSFLKIKFSPILSLRDGDTLSKRCNPNWENRICSTPIRICIGENGNLRESYIVPDHLWGSADCSSTSFE